MSIINSGKICLLDIDIQGVRDVEKNGLVNTFKLFIMTKSLDDLKQRLQKRGESDESIQIRLGNAAKEIELAHQLNIFDKILINDDLENFVEKGKKLVEYFYPHLTKMRQKF